ncbi:hypothetical protein BC831DRAFT_381465, partial [Entophlyctis helioformis]
FTCSVKGCDRTFTRKYNLDAHLRSHEDIRPYGCDACDRRFSRKHDLNRHVSSVHDRFRRYGPCPHCRSEFLRSDAFKRHLLS